MIGRFPELHQHGRPLVGLLAPVLLHDLFEPMNQALIELPLWGDQLTMEDSVLLLGELLLDLSQQEVTVQGSVY